MSNIRQVNKGSKVKQYTEASSKKINLGDDNSSNEEDETKIANLESEAESLRTELASLES